jgi:formylglycine-generating enzyme required for sulfatase activity
MSDAAKFSPGQLHSVPLAPGVALDFRYIPPTGDAGFRMGSRYEEAGTDWPQKTEQPIHRVRIAHGFWLGETPVTQAQFALWAQTHEPEHKNAFPDHDDHPAENMDWRQAVRCCDWLTKRMHAEKQFPAGTSLACLPTEAEWEYACRASTDTDYFTGDGEAALAEVGRFDEPYAAGTRPVRLGAKNVWGLHDLHGHVWQWCHDVWGEETYKPRPIYRRHVDGDGDPGAAERSADHATLARWKAMLENRRQRVMCGGSWVDSPGLCRSAYRDWSGPGGRNGILGFRLCLAPGPTEPKEKPEQEEAEAARGAGDGGRGTSPESRATRATGAGVKKPALPDLAKARLPRRPKNFP